MATKGRFGTTSKTSVSRSKTAKFGSRAASTRTQNRNATTPTRGGRMGKKAGMGGPLAG